MAKSKQLIGNHTTNLAECWMHIRAKFDGGKVVNRSQSGSWEHRCMGAGLRQNMGTEWGPQTWKNITTTSPNKIFSTAADHSAKKVEADRKRKATDKAKESRRKSKYIRLDDTAAARSAYNRHDGGISPEQVDDDIPTGELEQLKTSFYETKVVITEERRREIERSMRGQAESEQWMVERRKRLTASKVGSIAKMRKTTKRSSKVKNLLYSGFRGNEATRYGMANEEKARQDYITYRGRNGHPDLNVDEYGLFVSLIDPWLAASPDGIVYDPRDSAHILGVVEIKCPFSMRGKMLAEACQTATFCLEDTQNKYTLKHRHDYYYQIQCQLYCVDCDWCDLVVKTEQDIHIERIYRDKKWWELNLEKLSFLF